MIHFAYPVVLGGLLLLPFPWWWRRRGQRQRAVPFPSLQFGRVARWRRSVRWWSGLLEMVLGVVLVVALAGPYRAERVELFDDPGIDVMLVLDVSLSMLADDFSPDRLTVLRDTARAFLERSASHRVGIVLFAGEAFVQCPLTTDGAILHDLLEGVTVYAIDQKRSGGTAIGDALLVAVDQLAAHRLEGEQARDQAVVLITDGESNLGLEPVLAAAYAKQEGMRLYLVGIGGDEPVEVFFEGERVGGDNPYLAVLDDAELQAVAEVGEGRYYRARDGDALDSIFAELARLESSPLEAREVEVRHYWTSSLTLLLFLLFAMRVVVTGLVLERPLS